MRGGQGLKIIKDEHNSKVSSSQRYQIYELFDTEIFPFLSLNIRNILKFVKTDILEILEEIRLRANRPLIIAGNQFDYFVEPNGKVTSIPDKGYIVTKEDIQKTLTLISASSLYALEEEMRSGYITIKGGHRVGFTGKAVLEQGSIKTIKDITSLNIRISREVIGAANKVIKHIIDPITGRVFNTLIVSPPNCGKTTMLRDIIRQLSNGIPSKGFKGVNIGVVDERSELAGIYNGICKNNLGIRTDILDSCPKGEGIIILLRSMAPNVIATDEIGKNDDALAIEEAINAGVSIITTVHGSNIKDIQERPVIRNILAKKFFEVIIFLSRNNGPGTIEQVINGKNLNILR